jgi:hypothetical protein
LLILLFEGAESKDDHAVMGALRDFRFGFAILGIFALPNAFADTPDPHYCHHNQRCRYFVADRFPMLAELSARQVELLTDFVMSIGSASDMEAAYQSWAADHDDLAAEFLALTRALSEITYDLGNGQSILGIDLVTKINRIEGDRIRFTIDPAKYDAWKQAGARFSWALATGKVETGSYHFDRGDLGGSLHPGYDEQGYTSYFKVPRLQINYRESDSEGDIDLDGYAPWIWGFIPDPLHLTYANSDTRQWYGEYVKKLGDAGFSVTETSFGN